MSYEVLKNKIVRDYLAIPATKKKLDSTKVCRCQEKLFCYTPICEELIFELGLEVEVIMSLYFESVGDVLTFYHEIREVGYMIWSLSERWRDMQYE